MNNHHNINGDFIMKINNYKGSDFLSENFRERMQRECNPFGYNFLGLSKNDINYELESMKTKEHVRGSKSKK